MPRSAASVVENNFTKGLITEATGLNFPENAVTETFDCVFKQTGAVSRRLGFDDEPDAATTTVTRDGSAINEFLWSSVAGNGDINFVVVQVGSTLYYYNVDETLGLSVGLKSFSTDLTTHKIVTAPSPSTEFCEFSSGLGYLFIAHPFCDPFYISYDASTDTITTTSITVKIRDTIGLDDGFAPDERRNSTTNQHTYNLYNQGWWAHGVNAGNSAGDAVVLNDWLTWNLPPEGFGVYPSNSDVWWRNKTAQGEVSQTETRHKTRANSLAPRGHYILNAFNQDRSSTSLVDATDVGHTTSGITAVTSSYFRPKTIEFFASRVWYAGTDYLNFNNKIYYSQLIENINQIGLCYQINDPTSEYLADPLATDGGVIVIPDIGNIIKIISLQSALLIFASNGVWSIGGSSQGSGFKANDFAITKLAVHECKNKLSFVKVNGVPIWWGQDSIYTVQVDPTLGNIAVSPVIDKTIRTFYNEIPVSSKVYTKGTYNARDKIVSWLFKSTIGTDLDDNLNYNRVLNLNTITGAFYPWIIPDTSKKISSIISIKSVDMASGTFTVFDNLGNIVMDNLSNNVTCSFDIMDPLIAVTKFLTTENTTSTNYNMNWSQTLNNNYIDWGTEDYDSYFITGYKVHGDAIKKFQANWLTTYMLSEDNASCFVQTIRDYGTSGDSGKFSSLQQTYVDNPNRLYTSKRLKLRGAQLAYQLKFKSESGKPFTIIGWSTLETANSLP